MELGLYKKSSLVHPFFSKTEHATALDDSTDLIKYFQVVTFSNFPFLIRHYNKVILIKQ